MENGEGTVSTVAIIPAKMTSVRLPKKNIADLGGYPLLYYSIRAARLATNVDMVFLTSEDTEVLKLGEQYGAQPILRPEELAWPHVTNEKVTMHALETIQSRLSVNPEFIVLLQPTHPFRRPQDIDRGIDLMKGNLGADCLFTVIPAGELRGRIESGRFIPEFALPRDKSKEAKMYRNTGSFYIFRPERTLLRGKLFGDYILPFILERPEFEIDINEFRDLDLARFMLEMYREEFESMGYFSGV